LSPGDRGNPPGVGLSEQERARVERISDELAEAIESLSHVGPAVSIFGSARSRPESEEYRGARRLANRVAEAGITVITGGGPGVMEAGNRGAREAVGKSVGLNIELPHEQLANPYLDIDLDFRYFFTRKFMLIRYAIGFAIFPGGFGTIDELFELLTLVQTGKLDRRPIVLVGTDYWCGLHEWLVAEVKRGGFISPDDLDILEIVDDEDAAADILLDYYSANCPKLEQ
jgi:uncharacterized protein (TIGR00730 family)